MSYTKPLSGKEYACLQTLFATVSTWQEASPIFEKRAKEAGNDLWRDLRLSQSIAERVMQKLLKTVPVEKLRHVQEDIKHTHIYVKVEPPGMSSMPGAKGYSYVPTGALNELLNYLCEHECSMCDKTSTESRKCIWRKTIEESIPHEVGRATSEHCKYSDLVLGLSLDEE